MLVPIPVATGLPVQSTWSKRCALRPQFPTMWHRPAHWVATCSLSDGVESHACVHDVMASLGVFSALRAEFSVGVAATARDIGIGGFELGIRDFMRSRMGRHLTNQGRRNGGREEVGWLPRQARRREASAPWRPSSKVKLAWRKSREARCASKHSPEVFCSHWGAWAGLQRLCGGTAVLRSRFHFDGPVVSDLSVLSTEKASRGLVLAPEPS